jgi:hypothetical protein
VFCVVYRIEESWGPEGSHKGLEALDLSGKRAAVNPADRDDPPPVLDREDQAAVVLLRRVPEMRETYPVTGCVGRNLEHCRGVSLIDADFADFRSGRVELLQERRCGGGASGSVDDQTCRKGLRLPIVVLAVNR